MGVAASLPDPATQHLPAELVERVLRFLSLRDRCERQGPQGWACCTRSKLGCFRLWLDAAPLK